MTVTVIAICNEILPDFNCSFLLFLGKWIFYYKKHAVRWKKASRTFKLYYDKVSLKTVFLGLNYWFICLLLQGQISALLSCQS